MMRGLVPALVTIAAIGFLVAALLCLPGCADTQYRRPTSADLYWNL